MEMSIVHEKQAMWRRTKAWLEVQRNTGHDDLQTEIAQVSDMLHALPWGVRVRTLQSDCGAESFATLLTDNWLDDELINMLAEDLYIHARMDSALTDVAVVLPLSFQHVVQHMA